MIAEPSPARHPSKRHTIRSVQALRAFAASQVLIGHILLDIASRYHVPIYGLTKLPWLSGVDIFFCVSGFIMMLTSWDHFQETDYPSRFMMHRIIRVVPLYYIFTTLMVAVVLISPQMLGATKLDAGQILTSYLFFPYQRTGGDVQPVLSVGWTLNYEMFFYALFAASLLFRRRIAFMVITLAFVSMAVINVTASGLPTAFQFWTRPIILEFVAGAGIAYLYCSGFRLQRSRLIAVIGVSSAVLLFYARAWLIDALGLHIPQLVQDGLPALLLVASCTLLIPDSIDGKAPRWVVAMGDSSYALYLSHRFGMRAAAALWSAVIGLYSEAAGYNLAYAMVVFGLCIAIGHAVHLWIEKPLTRRLTRALAKRNGATRAVPFAPIDARS